MDPCCPKSLVRAALGLFILMNYTKQETKLGLVLLPRRRDLLKHLEDCYFIISNTCIRTLHQENIKYD